jgi:hypothetical protein
VGWDRMVVNKVLRARMILTIDERGEQEQAGSQWNVNNLWTVRNFTCILDSLLSFVTWLPTVSDAPPCSEVVVVA